MDKFEQYADHLTSPLTDGEDVTPGTALTQVSRAVYVGTSGAVRVTWESGTVMTLSNLAAGVWHPMRVSLIHSEGTDAADIKVAW